MRGPGCSGLDAVPRGRPCGHRHSQLSARRLRACGRGRMRRLCQGLVLRSPAPPFHSMGLRPEPCAHRFAFAGRYIYCTAYNSQNLVTNCPFNPGPGTSCYFGQQAKSVALSNFFFLCVWGGGGSILTRSLSRLCRTQRSYYRAVRATLRRRAQQHLPVFCASLRKPRRVQLAPCLDVHDELCLHG